MRVARAQELLRHDTVRQISDIVCLRLRRPESFTTAGVALRRYRRQLVWQPQRKQPQREDAALGPG